MTEEFPLKCEKCGDWLPYSEAWFTYADRGTWWEQSWVWHKNCAPADAEPACTCQRVRADGGRAVARLTSLRCIHHGGES